MKTVIIVDDLDGKRRDIKECLTSIFGENTTFIECECRSIAMREFKRLKDEINSHPEDYLLVLDMCFPVLTGSMPKSDMGLTFLTYLEIKEINIPTIMCSSDKIDDSLLSDYENINILGSIEYDSSVWLKPFFEELIQKQ